MLIVNDKILTLRADFGEDKRLSITDYVINTYGYLQKEILNRLTLQQIWRKEYLKETIDSIY
jgi:hypothetical protein